MHFSWSSWQFRLVIAAIIATVGIALALTGEHILSVILVLFGVAYALINVTQRPWRARPEGVAADRPRFLENTAQWVLVSVGVVLLLLGGAMIVGGTQAAADARNGNELLVAIGGLEFADPNASASGDAWAVAGVVVVCVGAAALLVLLAVKAMPQRADQ